MQNEGILVIVIRDHWREQMPHALPARRESDSGIQLSLTSINLQQLNTSEDCVDS